MRINRKKGVKSFKIVEHNKTLLYWIIALFILLLFVVSYIIYLDVKEKSAILQNSTRLGNPASSYCSDHGGQWELINDENGSYGLCTLVNGLKCEEWAYFRGECGNSNLGDSCSADSDCIPSSCCHSKSCINKNFAPNCSGMMCTMNCEPNTLDCGQASCGCMEGKCQVQIK